MIHVSEHITDVLKRISGGPHWWHSYRDGEFWGARAQWTNGNVQVVNAKTMDDALRSLLGRLLEIESDTANTEVSDAPVFQPFPVPASLPPVDPERGARIAELVAGVADAPAALSR
jgi:hypothetical protein